MLWGYNQWKGFAMFMFHLKIYFLLTIAAVTIKGIATGDKILCHRLWGWECAIFLKEVQCSQFSWVGKETQNDLNKLIIPSEYVHSLVWLAYPLGTILQNFRTDFTPYDL